jgi:hypothetical protein
MMSLGTALRGNQSEKADSEAVIRFLMTGSYSLSSKRQSQIKSKMETNPIKTRDGGITDGCGERRSIQSYDFLS